VINLGILLEDFERKWGRKDVVGGINIAIGGNTWIL
jgi:hypothetical protein